MVDKMVTNYFFSSLKINFQAASEWGGELRGELKENEKKKFFQLTTVT